jgi:hypothetical protein
MDMLSPNRLKQLGLAPLVVAAAATALLVLARSSGSPDKTLTYNGKSLDVWFYGSRTNFFHEQTRQAAQEAFDALGTNAFPFLLAKLKESRGSGAMYFSLYRKLPSRFHPYLPYPISGDDIKAIALGHIANIRRLAPAQVQTLADCVPALANPRLRRRAFGIMSTTYETDRAFLKLCVRLLDDAHPGIQLEAAISLAESSIWRDPREPRLFRILLESIENKERRDAAISIWSYQYGQQPPGGSGRSSGPADPLIVPGDMTLQARIEVGATRLELHLSPAQKDRLERALKAAHRRK